MSTPREAFAVAASERKACDSKVFFLERRNDLWNWKEETRGIVALIENQI